MMKKRTKTNKQIHEMKQCGILENVLSLPSREFSSQCYSSCDTYF